MAATGMFFEGTGLCLGYSSVGINVTPPIAYTENREKAVGTLKVQLPGFTLDEVTVWVDGNVEPPVLRISAQPKPENDKGRPRKLSAVAEFTYPVPKNVKESFPTSVLKDGFMYVEWKLKEMYKVKVESEV